MRTLRRVVAAAVVVGGAALAPAGIASAAPRPVPSEPQDQIVLTGRADVPRGRTVGQVVVVHGAAVVEGVAIGDVVVFSGRITVSGQVSGNVVDLDGTILLAPTAQIRGDVVSRGSVVMRKGAQVQGDVRQNVPFSLRGPVEAFGPLATWLAVSISGLLLGLALLWFAPRASDSVVATARRAPWACAGWAAGLLVFVPLLIVALAVTLVGLPLALAALLATALLLFVGYAWTAWIVGRLLVRPPHGRMLAFLAGFGALRIVGAIPFVGGLTWLAAGAFGLGAATVATWSARGARGKHRAGRADRAERAEWFTAPFPNEPQPEIAQTAPPDAPPGPSETQPDADPIEAIPPQGSTDVEVPLPPSSAEHVDLPDEADLTEQAEASEPEPTSSSSAIETR